MKTIPLTALEAASSGFTQKIVLDYTDVKAMTSGAASAIYTVPIGSQVQHTCARIVTPFASAGNTITLVATIGDGNDAARFLASQSLKGAAGLVLDGVITKQPYTYTAADTIDITPTAGTEAITVLTAGEVHIYMAIVDMAKLDA